jgi:hypothetical protein
LELKLIGFFFFSWLESICENYFIFRFYHSHTCTTDIVTVYGWPDNTCSPNSEESTSRRIRWPYSIEYDSLDCSGPASDTFDYRTSTCEVTDSVNEPVHSGNYVNVGFIDASTIGPSTTTAPTKSPSKKGKAITPQPTKKPVEQPVEIHSPTMEPTKKNSPTMKPTKKKHPTMAPTKKHKKHPTMKPTKKHH